MIRVRKYYLYLYYTHYNIYTYIIYDTLMHKTEPRIRSGLPEVRVDIVKRACRTPEAPPHNIIVGIIYYYYYYIHIYLPI